MLSCIWNHNFSNASRMCIQVNTASSQSTEFVCLLTPKTSHPSTFLYFQCLYYPDCNSSFILSMPASFFLPIPMPWSHYSTYYLSFYSSTPIMVQALFSSSFLLTSHFQVQMLKPIIGYDMNWIIPSNLNNLASSIFDVFASWLINLQPSALPIFWPRLLGSIWQSGNFSMAHYCTLGCYM